MYIEHCINPENNEFEIVAGGSAGYTMPDTLDVLLSDDRPYLKVYDSILVFKFEPVPFPVGISGHLKSIQEIANNQLFYFTFYFLYSAAGRQRTSLLPFCENFERVAPIAREHGINNNFKPFHTRLKRLHLN